MNPPAPLFTVFTPTYNRAHTLARVFNSLTTQTWRDFEWVLVDDGSTDGTPELVKDWATRAKFPIIYHRQVNSGKHVAINQGLTLARGAFFLIIDSDDGFTPDALERLVAAWDAVEDKTHFTGVLTLSQTDGGVVDGDLLPRSPMDSDALTLERRLKSRGERWGFHRTELLRRFHFPADPNVRFVPENIVWYAIAREFQLRCVNEKLRVYTHDSNNQLTKSALSIRAAVYGYYYILFFSYFDFARADPAYFARMALLYWRYRFHLQDDRVPQTKALCAHLGPVRHERSLAARICFAAAAMPGLALYLLDRAKGRRIAKGLDRL